MKNYRINCYLDGKPCGTMDTTYSRQEAEEWKAAYYEDDENGRKNGAPVPPYEYEVEEGDDGYGDEDDDDVESTGFYPDSLMAPVFKSYFSF